MFRPNLAFGQFTGGLNTKQRPHKIADNQLQSLISFDIFADSLRRSKGYTVFGVEPDADLVGKSLYTHSVLAGVQVMVKQIGTFLKYYDTVDGKWWKLTNATFTAGYRWSFDKFNGYLYGNNGVDNWIFWRGSARSTVQTALTPASITIDLATGEGGRFPTSGVVMIDDQPITFGGRTNDQLTTVSGITANIDVGSTVILQLDSATYSGLAQANQIAFFKNRLYMIDTDTPTIVRHSKLADNTNPETDLVNFTIAASGAGDAGFGIAPDEIKAIKVLVSGGSGSAVLAAFCKDGTVYAFTVTDSTNSTVNAFVPIRTMTTYPVSKQMVTVAENDLAITDNIGHIRTLGYGDVNTPLRVATISTLIEPSLELMDFEDGDMIYDKRLLYAVGKTPGADINNLTFFHDANYDAWGTHGHWDVSALTRYNDELYGLSSITGNVWKLNTGLSANEEQYASEAVLKNLNWGSPLTLKTVLKMRLAGLITSNCKTYVDCFFDNQEDPTTFLIDGSSDRIIIAEQPNVAVGQIVFGRGVFGGGLPGDVAIKEFAAELQYNTIRPFFKLTIRIRIDDKDVDFELNDMLFWDQYESPELWYPEKTFDVI